MYCHICGFKLDVEDVYCSKCGVKVKKSKETVPVEDKPEEILHDEQTQQIMKESIYPTDVTSDAAEKNTNEEVIDKTPEDTVSTPTVANPWEFVQPTEITNQTDTVSPTDNTPTDNISTENVISEPKEEKSTASSVEELTINFRPKELATNDFSSTQSNIFKPVPDLIIADADENPDKKQSKCCPGVVQVICSVLLSLFTFAFSFVLVLQLFIRFGFTEEKLQQAFNNVNYKEIKASSILNLDTISDKYGKEIPEDATLAEAIYNMIDQRELVNPISQSEVERLIERLDFQDFIAKKSSKAVGILRSGSKEQPVYADEVIEFLKKNQAELEKTIGIKILDVDYDYMQKYLEEHNDELLDVLSEKNITGTENSFGYALLRFVCSDWFIAVLGVLIIGIAVAIGFINKRFSSSMFYTGVPVTIAGFILLVFGIFFEYFFDSVPDSIPIDFVVQFATPVMNVFVVISAVMTTVGVVMIVLGATIKAASTRRKKQNLTTV